jgi:hypothetical protein
MSNYLSNILSPKIVIVPSEHQTATLEYQKRSSKTKSAVSYGEGS